MEIHALKRGLLLLNAIGIPTPAVEYRLPIHGASGQKADKLIMDRIGSAPQIPIAINPVAQWESKLWVPERFSILADHLISEHQAGIFFTGAAPMVRPSMASSVTCIIRQSTWPGRPP
jgi:heptosyltransferase-1